MTLRIGLDARTLLDDRPTGVERVLAQLVDSLHRVAPPDQEWLLAVDREPDGRLADLRETLPGELVVVPVRRPRLQRLADLWMALQMRELVAARRLDVFLSINTKLPFTPRPVVTTLHGIEWRFCPDDYRLLERVKQWTWFQIATRRSAGIVTFADHTAADLLRLRPRCRIPTRTVGEGVSAPFRRLAPEERSPETLARLGVRAPYVLSVCSLEPRKNVDGLVRAFARGVVAAGLPHALVLVGREGWRSDRLRALVARLSLSERVVLPGYVSDEELLQAYAGADLFAYPSRYEGFGLPVIEAMACGTPVLTSDASATREVAGDAALLVDPASEEELAAGLVRGLTDEELRVRLAAAGPERAARYSWDAMGRGICAFVAACAERASR